MASFGESLRQERLRRQITLEQVAEATKIGQRFLQAIEDERLQDLPGGVFNRNFIRNYARYLGLDEDHYVEEYVQSTGDVARTSDLPVVESGMREPVFSGTTLLALLIAGVVGLGIWAGIHLYQQQQRSRTVEAQATEPAVTPSTPATPARQLIPPPHMTPGARPAQTTPPTSQTASATQTATAGAGQSTAAPAFTPVPAPAGERALIVAATVQPAWVSIYTDGHWRLETTLKAGEKKEVFFHTKVQVNSGNAGATAITIDGKPMGTLGKIGMVAHFNWPAADAAPLGHTVAPADSPNAVHAQTGTAPADASNSQAPSQN